MPKFNQKGLAPLILIGIVLLALILGVWLVQTRTNILPHAQESMKAPQTAFILTKKNPNIPIIYEDPQVGTGSGTIIKSADPVKPGDQFAVDVRVSSDIDTANTFYALIAFPKDLLEVLDVIKQPHLIGDPILKYPKMDSILIQLIKELDTKGGNFDRLITDYGLDYKDGKIRVELRVSPKFDPKAANLSQYGFEQTATYENLIEGYAPIESLYKLAEVEYVDYISAIMKPVLRDNNSAVNQSVSSSGGIVSTSQVTGTQLIGPGCKVGGCSGQICQNSSEDGIITTCEYKNEYACYKNARCEKQADNNCGWTLTDDLQACLRLIVEKPTPTCKPIPQCIYSSGCEIYVDFDDPQWCKPLQPNFVKDYFIQFWLPDTGFNNDNGKIFLSGGTADGLKTSPGQQPIMATIVFKAKKAGEAKLAFTNDSLILRGGDSKNILTTKEGLTVNIQDPNKPVVKGDIDGDGAVGLRDFSIILSRWNSSDSKADLNGDGTVNLYDFSILLSNWTEKK